MRSRNCSGLAHDSAVYLGRASRKRRGCERIISAPAYLSPSLRRHVATLSRSKSIRQSLFLSLSLSLSRINYNSTHSVVDVINHTRSTARFSLIKRSRSSDKFLVR